jgi:hypothetical protein
MFKKAVRWAVMGAAVYGAVVFGMKVTEKMKLKKSGGDPKSVKWLK